MARKKKEEKQKVLTPKPEESNMGVKNKGIILDGENVEGLTLPIKLIEEVKVLQNHEANVNKMGFNGKLLIENPSSKDRLWDIKEWEGTYENGIPSGEFKYFSPEKS